MRHVIKINCIKHLNKNGTVLWEAKNLYNVLHVKGEQFILSAVFTGGTTNTYIPSYYYFGLDNRATPSISDTMASLSGEPTQYGYARQPVSSSGQFVVGLQGSNYRADCPLLTFTAVGGNWPSIQNLFLTNKVDNTGTLIATIALGSSIVVNAGETLTLQMGLALSDIS